jgi:hypothetical protein
MWQQIGNKMDLFSSAKCHEQQALASVEQLICTLTRTNFLCRGGLELEYESLVRKETAGHMKRIKNICISGIKRGVDSYGALQLLQDYQNRIRVVPTMVLLSIRKRLTSDVNVAIAKHNLEHSKIPVIKLIRQRILLLPSAPMPPYFERLLAACPLLGRFDVNLGLSDMCAIVIDRARVINDQLFWAEDASHALQKCTEMVKCSEGWTGSVRDFVCFDDDPLQAILQLEVVEKLVPGDPLYRQRLLHELHRVCRKRVPVKQQLSAWMHRVYACLWSALPLPPRTACGDRGPSPLPVQMSCRV